MVEQKQEQLTLPLIYHLRPKEIEWIKALIIRNPKITLSRLNFSLETIYKITIDSKTKAKLKKEVMASEKGQATAKAIKIIKSRPDITTDSVVSSVKFLDSQEITYLKSRFSKPNPYDTRGGLRGTKRVSNSPHKREFHTWDRPELIPHISRLMQEYPTGWLSVLSGYSFLFDRGWFMKYSNYYGFVPFNSRSLDSTLRSMNSFIKRFDKPWYRVSGSIAYIDNRANHNTDEVARREAIALYKSDTKNAGAANSSTWVGRSAIFKIGSDIKDCMKAPFSRGYALWLISATVTFYRGI